jgi:hypothetical protein
MSGPEKDETQAVGTAQGFQVQITANTEDCAEPCAERKRIATATARAALAGLALQAQADGAWKVFNPYGQPATVQSLQAAEAMIYGREQIRTEVLALMGRRVAPIGKGGAV